MRLTPIILTALIFTGLANSQLALAQESDEQTVKDVVERFLSAAGDWRLDAMKAMFTRHATIGSSGIKNGEPFSSVQSFEDWLSSLKSRTERTPYREPVTHFTVHVDQGLAFVRADAIFIVDGIEQARNIDYFTLIKEEGVWKFMNASYVSLPLEQK